MKWFYLRDPQNRPVACIATQLREDRSAVDFAISCCSFKDTINKAKGRRIATERLKAGKTLGSYTVLPNEIKQHVKSYIIAFVAEAPGIYKRARAAAELWLDNEAKKPIGADARPTDSTGGA